MEVILNDDYLEIGSIYINLQYIEFIDTDAMLMHLKSGKTVQLPNGKVEFTNNRTVPVTVRTNVEMSKVITRIVRIKRFD